MAVGSHAVVSRGGSGVEIRDRNMSRWMGWLGLGILILVAVGFVIGPTVNENALGPKVVSHYNSHQASGWASIYLVGAGLVLIVFFVSHLRGILREASGGRTFLPNAAFVGGILLIAGVAVTGAVIVALLLAAHNNQFTIARTLNFISENDELPMLFGAAVLTLTTGIAILAGSTLPKWIGWVSIVIAIVSVAGPISFIGFIATGVWFAVFGFVVAAWARKAHVSESSSAAPYA